MSTRAQEATMTLGAATAVKAGTLRAAAEEEDILRVAVVLATAASESPPRRLRFADQIAPGIQLLAKGGETPAIASLDRPANPGVGSRAGGAPQGGDP
ncbi:MAG: hypothetical protein ABSF76_09540 [Opitutaceae bacterium]|jgi:hypothetical protein